MTLPLFTANLNPSMSDFNALINQLNAIFTNVSVAGDQAVSGNLAVTGTTALTGNATAAGTLTVTGLTTLNGGLAGGSSANIAINTNKFTVAASTGNTLVAGTLAATGLVTATAGMNSADNLTMTAAAKGLVLKQGANGKCGTFVANGSTPVTVSNTSIATTDTVMISLNTVGGTIGSAPVMKTITASTGFTVTSGGSDTSTYNYVIISNAA